MRLRAALLGLAFAALAPAARAHEARPAYLEIKETAPGRYALLWRTPVLSGMRLPVLLKLPDGVRNRGTDDPGADGLPPRAPSVDAGPGGLAGKRIEFVGLQGTITDVLVRVELLDGRKLTMIVRPSQSWVEIAASQARGGPGRVHRPRHPPHRSSAPTTCCSCSGCC